ncbi:helix-turn-helix domain-containing protein [Pseudomonas sp. SIMBA_068]|uniref:helix-turn-helix domain-containing protein n=1 Tax=Pseudomonas sp. SIMBA_068 TaxID=3085808 RepID=UPI00397A045E
MASEITPIVLSPNDAAKALSISRSSIYALMRNGALPWVQFGADRRIHIDEIKRLAIEGVPSAVKKA